MLFSHAQWLLVIAVMSFTQSSAEKITFPSDISFETVSPDTGASYRNAPLFNAANILNKKLSLSFKVRDFKHSTADTFRANPVLFTCLQRLQTHVQGSGERIELVSGYVPPGLAGSSYHDVYQSTGSAARIKLKAGGTMTNEQLTSSAIRTCVPIFQEVNRDIGIVVYTDQVQIHLQPPDDDDPAAGQDPLERGPYYHLAPGVTGVTLENLASVAIDQAYDLPSTGQCDTATSPSLSPGELFPDTVSSLEEAVGGLDTPIRRTDKADFGRLGQYPARHIDFQDDENGGACANIIIGSTLETRCPDRTMSYRLMRILRSVAKATFEDTNVKLKVLEAWDDPDSREQPEGSLHHEGRAAIVVASDGDDSKLVRISALAICAGVDAVMHNGDHLVLAVLKQKDATPRAVPFTDNLELLEVAPPEAMIDVYKLRDEFSEIEAQQYPLFDAKDRHALKLSQDVTLGFFVPKDGRYLRLSPYIVSCMQSIITKEQKLQVDMPLQVCRSYYNQIEIDSEIDIFDKKFPSAGLGVSMELSTDCEDYTSTELPPLDLYDQMITVIAQCAPIFFGANARSMGIGLYRRAISVDIRPKFSAWAEDDLLRDGATEAEFEEHYLRWATRAIQGRIVDPNDPERSCKVITQPRRQDPLGYRYEFPEEIAEDTEEDSMKCIPVGDTPFCTSTQKHRNTEVERLWKTIKLKHLFHNETELEEALMGCIGTCGTCSEGEFWNIKIEHCNNLLHWMPFGFLNAEDDVNFFLQQETTTSPLEPYACEGHCIKKTPLWAQMVTTLKRIYRPKEDESVQEKLYSTTDNPSPVMQIINNMYAMSAVGIVKVWVQTEQELITMKDVMKHVFVYSLNVTEVRIYVLNASNKNVVASVIQTFFTEWTQGACLDYSREYLPPVTVSNVPRRLSKRSAEFDVRDSLLHRHHTWEDRWINGHPLF